MDLSIFLDGTKYFVQPSNIAGPSGRFKISVKAVRAIVHGKWTFEEAQRQGEVKCPDGDRLYLEKLDEGLKEIQEEKAASLRLRKEYFKSETDGGESATSSDESAAQSWPSSGRASNDVDDDDDDAQRGHSAEEEDPGVQLEELSSSRNWTRRSRTRNAPTFKPMQYDEVDLDEYADYFLPTRLSRIEECSEPSLESSQEVLRGTRK